MKLSEGFTRLWPSVGIFVFYAASIACLTLAVKVIDISIAYAVWSAVGIAVIATIGVLFFHEPLTLQRGFFLTLVIAGVIGLKLSS